LEAASISLLCNLQVSTRYTLSCQLKRLTPSAIQPFDLLHSDPLHQFGELRLLLRMTQGLLLLGKVRHEWQMCYAAIDTPALYVQVSGAACGHSNIGIHMQPLPGRYAGCYGGWYGTNQQTW
jgi:hypothetical protein